MDAEDIKLHLPRYLSDDSLNVLRESLKDSAFTADRLYSFALNNDAVIYQGDCITDLPYIELPSTNVKAVTGMVLSNTCDIDPQNKRFFSAKMTYALTAKLENYVRMLKDDGIEDGKIKAHVTSLRSQEITQLFFLPGLYGLFDDSVVFLDRISHVPNDFVERSTLNNTRKIILSNYGSYLLLLKLSYHFCRMQDKVDRDSKK